MRQKLCYQSLPVAKNYEICENFILFVTNFFFRFKSEKTGRGPLVGPEWKNKVNPVMTCYKLVTCEFKWFGLQSRVESFIQKTERRLFTVFHRWVANQCPGKTFVQSNNHWSAHSNGAIATSLYIVFFCTTHLERIRWRKLWYCISSTLWHYFECEVRFLTMTKIWLSTPNSLQGRYMWWHRWNNMLVWNTRPLNSIGKWTSMICCSVLWCVTCW